jgi:general secretion pathway protein G
MTRAHWNQRRPIRRGFTLVEVIVMVTIVAILGAVVATTMLRQGAEGRAQAARIGANRIRTSLQQYLVDQGLSRPIDGFDLSILARRPEDGGGHNGPYVNSEDHLNDPWGTPYFIEVPGEKNFDFDIISYGEGGEIGGEGPQSDIRQ